MLKNKIPLCAFIGTNIIALSLMFFTAFFSLVLENSDRLHYNEGQIIGLSTSLLTAGSLLLTGIGFILRKKWARHVFNIMIILCAALLVIGVYIWVSNFSTYTSRMRFLVIQLSMVILTTTTLGGIFLFLNNVRVIEELEEVAET